MGGGSIRSKSPEAIMLKINGRRVFNLTGQSINLAADGGQFIAIPSEGIVKVYYVAHDCHHAETWEFCDDSHESRGTAKVILSRNDGVDYDTIDDVDPVPEEWDGDFIVSNEYYLACRELGLPTDRFYTVAGPIDDWTVVEGYAGLIKR